MRYWYVSKRRERVFDHTSMILIVVVLAALLVWLFPQQSVYRKRLPASEIDAVSIAYLQVLLQSAPRDVELRINLIDQMIQTGQFKPALNRLEELDALNQDAISGISKMLRIRILAQLVYAAESADEGEQPYLQQLNRLMLDLASHKQSPQDRQHIIDIALALGRTKLAAQQYQVLAEQVPERRVEYLSSAIKWYQASEDHRSVAETYVALSNTDNAHQQRTYIRKAVDSYQMLSDTESALAIYASYLKKNPADGDLLLAAARLAMSVNNSRLTNQYLTTLIQLRPDNAEFMLAAQKFALSIGNTKLALAAAQRYTQQVSDNWGQRATLARLYEWDKQPDQALDQWRYLNRHQPSGENTDQMLRLAVGLYRHDVAIDEMEPVMHKRRLSSQELRLLANSYEESGEPDRGAEFFYDYVRRYPDHRDAWVITALLLERDQRLEQAIYVWGQVEQRFGLDVAEGQTVASLMWALNDPESALAVMLNIRPLATAVNRTYWRMLATLAWQRGQSQLAIESLSYLISDGVPLSSDEADIVLWVQSPENRELQLRVASSSWYRFKKPHYLLTYMQLLYNMQRWSGLQQAMIVADAHSSLFEHDAQYWLLKAALHNHKADTLAAREAYVHALEITGNSVSAVNDFMWFLINSRSHQDLRYFLPLWQELAQDEPLLWPIYAAANTLLTDYQAALSWYKKLIDNDANDQYTLLAYADTLELAGRKSEAWRMRRYLLEGIRQDLFNPSYQADNWTTEFAAQRREQTLYNKLRLVNAVYSYRDQYRAIGNSQGEMAETAWLPMFTDRLIAGGHSDTGIHWQLWNRRNKSEELPIFQRVSLVYSSYDGDEMAQLLNRREELLPSMQAHLLDRLGETGQALASGIEDLDSRLGESQQQELRELLTQRGNERPSGARIEWQLDGLGEISVSGPSVTIAQATDDWHFRADLESLDWQATNGFNIALPGQEKHLELSVRRELMTGHWQVDTFQNDREDASLSGLRLHYRREWDSALITHFEAAWQDLPNVTPLMRAYGQFDHIDATFEQLLSARDTVRIDMAVNRFADRYSGDTFAQGYTFGLNYFHRMNFEDPEWTIQAGVEWMQNDIGSAPDLLLQNMLSAANLGEDALLPQEFGQIVVGSTWQHGDLHSLNARAPTPRYLLNTSMSYQWPRDDFGFAVELGLGWRLFGNDELALSYRFNSAPIGTQGSSAQDIRISYSYRFGR